MAMTGGTAVLVKTGYPNYGTETSFPLRLYVYYKVVSQDKVNAITTMSLGMYFVVPDAWYVGPWSDYGSYLGTTSNTFSAPIGSNFSGTKWLVENVTFKVQHDAQGKGTASIKWKWGVDSSYGQMESPSGTVTVSLPDIPRASSVSAGGSVNAGSALTIYVSRAVASFTHTLRYAFGSVSGTIATGVETSCSWTIPYSFLLQFPSATSGKGTIYCDTYSGNTLTGTTSCEFTVMAPDNDTTKPKASMMLSPSGSVPAVFDGLYIRGKTAVKADFTASSDYSTVKSYALSVEGKTVSGDPAISSILSSSGTVTVTGTVTDARGYVRTITEDITVQPYDTPGVAPGTGQNSVICERALSTGESDPAGTYLRIIAKRRYSAVDGRNGCVLRYRYKQSSADSYGAWFTLLAESAESDEYSDVISDVVSSVTTSYDVEIGVEDTMGGSYAVAFHIPTDEVSFHIRPGGKGAAFFGYSEKDDELSLTGRRISNLGTPTEAGDAVPLGYAQGAFASAGFGYGETVKFFYFNNDTDGSLLTAALDELTAGMGNREGRQIGIADYPAMSGATYYGTIYRHTAEYIVLEMYSYESYGRAARRVKFGGVWYPWEWENPHMAAGVEYRTTERYAGKPVYVQLFDCAGMPGANSTKSIEHNVEIANILDFCGNMSISSTGSNIALPYRYTSTNFANLSVDYKKITLESGGTSLAAYVDVKVWIKYTKQGD